MAGTRSPAATILGESETLSNGEDKKYAGKKGFPSETLSASNGTRVGRDRPRGRLRTPTLGRVMVLSIDIDTDLERRRSRSFHHV